MTLKQFKEITNNAMKYGFAEFVERQGLRDAVKEILEDVFFHPDPEPPNC